MEVSKKKIYSICFVRCCYNGNGGGGFAFEKKTILYIFFTLLSLNTKSTDKRENFLNPNNVLNSKSIDWVDFVGFFSLSLLKIQRFFHNAKVKKRKKARRQNVREWIYQNEYQITLFIFFYFLIDGAMRMNKLVIRFWAV